MPRPSLPAASSLASSSKAGSSQLSLVAAQEAALSSSPSNLNPLAALLDILSSTYDPLASSSAPSPEQVKVLHAGVYALHRALSSLLRQGRLHGRMPGEDENVRQVREWALARYSEYTDVLVALLGVPGKEHNLRLDALGILMALVRTEVEMRRAFLKKQGEVETDQKVWPSELWAKIVRGLLTGTLEHDVRSEFVLRYFNFCDDLRYFFLNEAGNLSASFQPPNAPPTAYTSNLLTLLESLTTMPTDVSEINEFWAGKPPLPSLPASTLAAQKRKAKAQQKAAAAKRAKKAAATKGATGVFDDSSDDGFKESSEDDEGGYLDKKTGDVVHKIPNKFLPPLLSLSGHKKAFSLCWLAFLGLPLASDQIKRILSVLHRLVLPHLIEPRALMDFLVDATDQSSVVGLLALDGLFTLISKHDLDYPGFFEKLYALLDRHVLHVRYRPRFLRMLNTFLSSTHLPALLVASFIKRLARLSLFAPPAAIVSIIPFCYNHIKSHPSCMQMLHRPDGWPRGMSSDPFLEDEKDPLKTEALSSSLWELSTLRSHSLASVATLAKIFAEAFDKPGYDMEDFLDHSYGTLFETEAKRQIRKPPALSMELSADGKISDLFPTSAQATDVAGRDIVGQMWVF